MKITLAKPEAAFGSDAVEIRQATKGDLAKIAEIGTKAFSGLRPEDSGLRWVTACFSAFPRMEYWVAESGRTLVGYILWNEKGGFRKDAVLELEQIAVSPNMRSRGVGRRLITLSLEGVRQRIQARGSHIKIIEVTTGTEQEAVEFYRRTLGAEVVAQIPDYFRGTEFILISRDQAKG